VQKNNSTFICQTFTHTLFQPHQLMSKVWPWGSYTAYNSNLIRLCLLMHVRTRKKEGETADWTQTGEDSRRTKRLTRDIPNNRNRHFASTCANQNQLYDWDEQVMFSFILFFFVLLFLCGGDALRNLVVGSRGSWFFSCEVLTWFKLSFIIFSLCLCFSADLHIK